uniref:TATA box-binding protein-associated factor RNA polymerase I subunit B n=2 Tax=Arion vulgaris TaxID=1028688 RepID=A0A0B7A062_9EUPU
MPYNCPVCNNDDYNEIDGHFFCTECQTQSQELIVQEVSGDTEVNFRCEVKVAEAGTHTLTKKPKVDLGRPWTIYEAYQIIILAQVDGLIEQGASQDLKDVVFTIWANYLSNLGVAFCSKEKLVPDVVTRTRIGRRRELHRGTFSNPLNRRKRPFSERSSKGCHETSHLMGETFYDDDNPVDEINDNIVFLDDSNGANKTQAAKRFAARRSRVAKSPEWMDMNKTIAICYIGLMFTNRNILPIDVVRFVYESKVPFLSVTHLLPPDMVLSARDKALFESSRFDTKTLSAEVSRLLSYMKLEVMPTPDLDVIIPCFVHQLCLP